MSPVRQNSGRSEDAPMLGAAIIKGLALAVALVFLGSLLMSAFLFWWEQSEPGWNVLRVVNYVAVAIAAGFTARSYRHKGWLAGGACALAYGTLAILVVTASGLGGGFQVFNLITTGVTLFVVGAVAGMLGVNL